MVLIFIFLMISDVENIFMERLVIWMFSLEKCFCLFAYFKIRFFLLISCKSFFNKFWITPYLIRGLQLFTPIPWVTFLFCCFFCIAAFKFYVVLLVDFFFFCCLCFRCHTLKIIAKTNIEKLFPYKHRNFMVSSLTLKSLIHLQLIFVSSVK